MLMSRPRVYSNRGSKTKPSCEVGSNKVRDVGEPSCLTQASWRQFIPLSFCYNERLAALFPLLTQYWKKVPTLDFITYITYK